MALGAAKALGAKVGKSVMMAGFDGTPDGIKAVESGTLYAPVAQQPRELGRMAVPNAVRATEGKSVADMVPVPVPVPVKMVTSENVADFKQDEQFNGQPMDWTGRRDGDGC